MTHFYQECEDDWVCVLVYCDIYIYIPDIYFPIINTIIIHRLWNITSNVSRSSSSSIVVVVVVVVVVVGY